MSRTLIYLIGLLVAGLLVSACNSHTDLPPDPQSLILAGQPLYENNCAACHQKDGQGQPGKAPKLASNPIVTLENPVPVITIVVDGKNSMPEFGDKLKTDQIAEILSYIRNTWGNQAPAVSVRQIP